MDQASPSPKLITPSNPISKLPRLIVSPTSSIGQLQMKKLRQTNNDSINSRIPRPASKQVDGLLTPTRSAVSTLKPISGNSIPIYHTPRTLKKVASHAQLPKLWDNNSIENVDTGTVRKRCPQALKKGPSNTDSETYSPNTSDSNEYPIVKRYKKTTSQAAGDGPTLKISDEANEVLGGCQDDATNLNRDFAFPPRSSNCSNWPLPKEDALFNFSDDVSVEDLEKGVSLEPEFIEKSRQVTLATLEGRNEPVEVSPEKPSILITEQTRSINTFHSQESLISFTSIAIENEEKPISPPHPKPMAIPSVLKTARSLTNFRLKSLITRRQEQTIPLPSIPSTPSKISTKSGRQQLLDQSPPTIRIKRRPISRTKHGVSSSLTSERLNNNVTGNKNLKDKHFQLNHDRDSRIFERTGNFFTGLINRNKNRNTLTSTQNQPIPPNQKDIRAMISSPFLHSRLPMDTFETRVMSGSPRKITTPRKNAPLPARPVATPLDRHNDLMEQATNTRETIRVVADRVKSNKQKFELLQSLEYFNSTVIQSAQALAAYENAQIAALQARTCWESCHLAIQKHMELLEKQKVTIDRGKSKRLQSF